MSGRVSVVIPCYNAVAFLRESVQSALSQTVRPFEVIVVDDVSTDGSTETVADLPVRIVHCDTKHYEAGARNRGIEVAQGDLIATLDADDIWEAEHLEVSTSLLARFPSAIMSFTAARRFGDSRSDILAPQLPESEPIDALAMAFERVLGTHSTSVLRRDYLLRVGGYTRKKDHRAPDFDLWLRLARLGRAVASHRVTARYRVHESQLGADPFPQLRDAFQSRRETLDSMISDGDARAPMLENRTLQIWRRQVRLAIRDRDADGLATMVAALAYVPNIDFVSHSSWKVITLLAKTLRLAKSQLP